MVFSIIDCVNQIETIEKITIDQTKEMLEGNPYKIAEWIAQNIKPVHEDLQYGQPPKYTYKYKKGDCEDIAMLAQYFIGDKYKTYLVEWRAKFAPNSKYYEKYGHIDIRHVVLAIKIDDYNWLIIDQDKCIGKANTLKEIIYLNCELRRVDVKKAFIVDIYRFHYEILEQVIGE
jgi:hypothetical protein